MLDEKENSNLVLLIASIIVCSLRYLAILLPNWETFSIWKSLEEAPQQYCLDFAIIIIFIINTYSILKNKTERTAIICWTEAISFASIVPAWRYMVDFFGWLETGELEELNRIMRNTKELFKVLLETILFLISIAIIIWIFQHRNKIKKIIFIVLKAIKKDVFMAQFMILLCIVHFIRLGTFLFIKNGFWTLLSYNNKIDIIMAIAFFIALVMILIHYRKKEEALTPAAWVGILLCLLGMTPIQTSIVEEILDFLYQYKAEKELYAIVPLLLLGFTILIVCTVLVLSVRIYQHFHSIKLKETKFWKICEKELLLGHKKIWFFYLMISLLFIIGAILIFVKWINSSIYFIPEYHGFLRRSWKLLEILIIAVLFLFFIITALCQIGAFLLRTLKQIDALTESNRKKYYIAHGISGFLALLFTLISWYIFTRISFDKENLLGLTIPIFQYLFLPIILMVWYSVLFKIVDMILKRENDESDMIIMQIEKHIYELSYNFVNTIFAPFRFLFSYINSLSEAMLEDNKEDNQENDRKRSFNKKKEKKKQRKIKAANKEDIQKLREDKEIVKILSVKGKTKGGTIIDEKTK